MNKKGVKWQTNKTTKPTPTQLNQQMMTIGDVQCALVLGLALVAVQITSAEEGNQQNPVDRAVAGSVHRGDRVVTRLNRVPWISEYSKWCMLRWAEDHDETLLEYPPVFPTGASELVSVYLTLPEAEGVLEGALFQCMSLCMLVSLQGVCQSRPMDAPINPYDRPGTMCEFVQVETRACHPLTCGDRLTGDTSDASYVWCFFGKLGGLKWKDVGVRQGTRKLYNHTLAEKCMAVMLPGE